jgi:hypothetical protein
MLIFCFSCGSHVVLMGVLRATTMLSAPIIQEMLPKSKQAAELEIFLVFATIWLLKCRRFRGRKFGQVRLTVIDDDAADGEP